MFRNKRKYKLSKEAIKYDGRTLYRIKALKNIGEFPYDVHKGDFGGYVENEENLSQEGRCWIYNDAKVYGNARVYCNAIITDCAIVCGNASVNGLAEISGDAMVKELSDYIVFKNSWSSGRYFTWTKSNDMWRVGSFYGTGEELIKKSYKDSEIKGKSYEIYTKLVKELSK
jgi:hypothetical protein